MSPELTDNREASRYELRVDGTLAGLIDYRLRDRQISLVHTEILDAFEGQGLGSLLARGALEDARERDLQVIPLCPFIAGYIRKHPDDYLDLVSPPFRSRLAPTAPGG
jgi:uncharacterized protein